MKRLVLLVLVASCGRERCMERLEERARPSRASESFEWPEAVPIEHLHLTRDELAWDPVTDVSNQARSTGVCPDPLPPAPNVLVTGGADQAFGLYEVLRLERPGVRIAPDVPYSRVQWLFDRMRRTGMTQVDLRRIRCTRSCAPQALRVWLSDWPARGEHFPRDRVRAEIESERAVDAHRAGAFVIFSEPAPPSGFHLHVVETETGWRVSSLGGDLAPGCELTTVDPIDTVTHEAGLDRLTACLRQVKREFPDEEYVALTPADSTPWTDVVNLIEHVRMDGGSEFFPEVLLPPGN